ncbi:hypothetical protein [Micromonospora sp. NPDC000442]|uniref:hypothetical protein n=1 Tax=Micromonospora sp. NPDC000442 TaxID=3364217 RepID=UPI0036AF6C46
MSGNLSEHARTEGTAPASTPAAPTAGLLYWLLYCREGQRSGLSCLAFRGQQSTSVSLVAFVASGGSGGGDSEGVYQMAGQLAVINAGPAPVTASAATGQLPGIRVRGTGQSRLLRPGGTGWIDVEVNIDCSIPFDSEPLSMRFAVETADGRVREVSYPVAVIGSAWHREVERPCAHLAGLVKDDG